MSLVGSRAQGRRTLRWRRWGPEPAGGPIDLSPEDAEQLGGECAKFLSGTYRDDLESGDRPIHAWVWINSPAHGGSAELESAAATRRGVGPSEALIAAIAAALLGALNRGATSARLQRNTLIPLEWALAGRAAKAPTDSVELGRTIKAVSATRLRPTPMAGPKR